jgi:cyanobactin maturation PatA/PatG family protease
MPLLEQILNISVPFNLDALWNKTLGDPDICIAVLDGSVDQSHACFKGADLTEIRTLVSDSSSIDYALQHGTHVASIIFGQHVNDSHVLGIAPHCRGLIVPIFADGLQGSLVPCSQLDLARAITQSVEQGAHVINISGGQITQSGQADPLLVRAIQLCADRNVVIVAAAGNNGCQCLHLPAALPTVLTVGAMDTQGLPLDFSNWGDAYQKQGILAPGENILGAVPGGGTDLKTGTSFATPIVTGVVALLLSLQIKQGGSADPQAIRAAILKSALPCNQQISEDCRRFLVGSLNIGALQTIVLNEKRSTMSELNPKKMTNCAEAKSMSQIEASISPSVLEELTVANLSDDIASLPHADNLVNIPAVMPSSISTSVTPSEGCSCGRGESMKLIYALGELDYDFGSEARLDYFAQSIFPANPTRSIPKTDFLNYLSENPWEAQSFNLIIKLDSTPIYAIVPSGPFASVAYERLRSALSDDNVERVSIPGYLAGSVRLLSGQIVPAIVPDIRGIYSWSTSALIESLTNVLETESSQEQLTEKIQDYLDRIYYEYRNLGVTPQERALNFSATNAFQIGVVMSRGVAVLEVEKSPICRSDAECYDVKLIFFDPENLQRSRTAFRFTVDVSDVIPILIGSVRRWNLR